MKTCSKCNLPKEEKEFYKNKNFKDGLQYDCKLCHQQEGKENYLLNAQKIITRTNKYRKEHLCNYRKYVKNWELNNSEKHKSRVKIRDAKNNHTEKGRLNNTMSVYIAKSLHGTKAGKRWEDLVGYTVDQLKRHLEKLFKEGMSWDNYGKVWEIDHKIPVAVFNYEKPEHLDFKLCWDIKNLQPLECSKNRSKQDKLDKPFQPSLALVI